MDDDPHNVDMYDESVRACDRLRPERAPHRRVEYVPRAALDAATKERDEARAEVCGSYTMTSARRRTGV